MRKLFTTKIHPPSLISQPVFWFIFKKENILLHRTTTSINIPLTTSISHLNIVVEQQHYLGIYDNIHCFTAEINQETTMELPVNMFFQSVRKAYEFLDYDLFFIISKAMQILYWDKHSKFCGSCSQKMEYCLTERSKACSVCNKIAFPTISPAVLALIWRKNEILLARAPHFLPGVYSILSGFVEVGETLEDCVKREVQEEVGVTIKNIHYISSQPWPFPSNLMIGFKAEYVGGNIVCDLNELEDAKWFRLDQLPALPIPTSLSRQMIDTYKLEYKKTYLQKKL